MELQTHLRSRAGHPGHQAGVLLNLLEPEFSLVPSFEGRSIRHGVHDIAFNLVGGREEHQSDVEGICFLADLVHQSGREPSVTLLGVRLQVRNLTGAGAHFFRKCFTDPNIARSPTEASETHLEFFDNAAHIIPAMLRVRIRVFQLSQPSCGLQSRLGIVR